MLKHKKKSQGKEIVWNIVNSLLAGVLVLLGALTTGEINAKAFFTALVIAFIVAVTQFKNYWMSEEGEYKSNKIHGFMKIL